MSAHSHVPQASPPEWDDKPPESSYAQAGTLLVLTYFETAGRKDSNWVNEKTFLFKSVCSVPGRRGEATGLLRVLNICVMF